MAYLANADVADFNELKEALHVTQGNLSVQLRKPEDAAYITIDKGYLGRKPRTQAGLTPACPSAFVAYLEAPGRVIGRQAT